MMQPEIRQKSIALHVVVTVRRVFPDVPAEKAGTLSCFGGDSFRYGLPPCIIRMY